MADTSGRSLPPVLAHYMPWFSCNPGAKRAGWHWTMGTVNVFETGRVAAHETPLIGPYSSDDPQLVRYHLELMRLCGVRGVIVNWYGTRPVKDFPFNLRAADVLADECERAGMLFSICYEDWTVVDGLQWGEKPAESALQAALTQLRTDWEYIRDRYVSRPNFLREGHDGVAGRPVALVFGPRNLKDTEDWTRMLSHVFPQEASRPLLLTLPHIKAVPPGGHFCWLPAMRLEAPFSSIPEIHSFLQRFYEAQAKAGMISIGAVWPGFKDFYVEGSGGKQKSYGFLPDHDGRTIEAAFARARIHQPAFVQLVTWNDWQEGTALEPSKEKGYYWLLKLQQHILGRQDEEVLKGATAAFLTCLTHKKAL